jgi:hypothetical protein
MWKGTYSGSLWSDFREIPKVWDDYFGEATFSIKSFGISGTSRTSSKGVYVGRP